MASTNQPRQQPQQQQQHQRSTIISSSSNRSIGYGNRSNASNSIASSTATAAAAAVKKSSLKRSKSLHNPNNKNNNNNNNNNRMGAFANDYGAPGGAAESRWTSSRAPESVGAASGNLGRTTFRYYGNRRHHSTNTDFTTEDFVFPINSSSHNLYKQFQQTDPEPDSNSKSQQTRTSCSSSSCNGTSQSGSVSDAIGGGSRKAQPDYYEDVFCDIQNNNNNNNNYNNGQNYNYHNHRELSSSSTSSTSSTSSAPGIADSMPLDSITQRFNGALSLSASNNNCNNNNCNNNNCNNNNCNNNNCNNNSNKSRRYKGSISNASFPLLSTCDLAYHLQHHYQHHHHHHHDPDNYYPNSAIADSYDVTIWDDPFSLDPLPISSSHQGSNRKLFNNGSSAPYRFYMIRQRNYPPLYLENGQNRRRIYRVLVLGYPSAGKSSLLEQFAALLLSQDQQQQQQQHSGTGIEKRAMLRFNPANGNQLNEPHNLLIHFLESDSFDKYLLQVPVTDYQPDAYLILYSVVSRDSFNSVKKTLVDLQRWDDVETKSIIIVANKSDLVRGRSVTRREGKDLATGNQCKYIETSCTIGHNIDVLLQGIGSQILLKEAQQQKLKELEKSETLGIRIKRKPNFFKRILRKTAINKSKSCDNLHVL